MVGGTETILDVVDDLKNSDILKEESSALKDMFGGDFDFAREEIKSFTSFFEQNEASEKEIITLYPGFDENYDKAVKEADTLLKELEEYLVKLKKKRHLKKLKYIKRSNNYYQIEVSSDVVSFLPPELKRSNEDKECGRTQIFASQESLENARGLIAAESKQEALRNPFFRKKYTGRQN
uniref:MutS_IV domain-containing protein n=1 Tax=Strongyloides papillosus TaxID=174720 RepID=A0A0N5BEX1_STREA